MYIAVDGNDSLKHHSIRSTGGITHCNYPSRYQLDPCFVNKHSFVETEPEEEDNDPPTGNSCMSHFQAKKGRVESLVFWETGWFPMVCSHGTVLVYTNMIQTLEFSKFPLALIRWLADWYSN